MEVRFSEALPLENIRRGMPLGSGPPVTIVPKQPPPAGAIESVKAVESVEGEEAAAELSRATVTELVKGTAEVLSTFDRSLKYEVRDDAGVVQVQVIDPRDGRVVRKIPADEVIKFIEQMKAQIDDRVDILA